MIARMYDDSLLIESEAVKIHMISSLTIKNSTSMNISSMTMINRDMPVINLNIKDLELIEMSRQDIHRTLNHSATIRSMMTIENINLEIFSRIIRTIRMTQTRLILILILSIQNSSQIRMILTKFRDLLSIQIKLQTTANINHGLIHSRILHSRMIH
jgi:hypothetical protein